MVFGAEDQDIYDKLDFLWETQSWGLSNSDNSDDETIKNNFLGITTINTPPINTPPPPPPPPPPKNKGVIIIESNDEEAHVNNNNKRNRASRDNDKGKEVMVINGDGKWRDAEHELHIWTERERRKKMRNMFANLHALLPQLPSKADKSSIVDEAVRYIKSLEKSVENLEKVKREKLQAQQAEAQAQAVSPIACESSVISWNPYEQDNYYYCYSSSSNNSSPTSSSSPPLFPPSVAFKTTFVSPNLVLTMFGNNEGHYNICAPKKEGLSSTIAFVLEKHKLDVVYATIVSNPDANRYIIFAHANKALGQLQDAGLVEQTFRRAAGEIMMWLS